MISIIAPAYKCKESIEPLYQRIDSTSKLNSFEFELIFVNDSSPQDDWNEIKKICLADQRVKGINLSKNFGQHYAISAGINLAKGDWIVVMDCDLQDKPEEIPKLYKKALEGYEIVYAKREIRNDSFVKKMSSKLFYRVLSYLTDTEQDSSIANFGIYSKKVIDVIKNLKETFRYFPVMVRWSGFKSVSVTVEHSAREFGNTSYNFSKLFDLALNVILSFSDKPLKLIVKSGFVISFISAIFTLCIVIQALIGSISVIGWASTISSIWFLSGLIMLTLGITGLYIGKIFDQVKNRPSYIIREILNDD